jgi:hypothetical protein
VTSLQGANRSHAKIRLNASATTHPGCGWPGGRPVPESSSSGRFYVQTIRDDTLHYLREEPTDPGPTVR